MFGLPFLAVAGELGSAIKTRVTERTIEETQPPVRIGLPYLQTRVDIHLERDGDRTDLTLLVRGVRPHEWDDVHAGWLNVLLPFQAWVDFGVDLPNHDRRRTWAERYVDQ